MTFKDLQIIEPILKALQNQGYTKPTEIQELSIPILLNNKDLLGCAQTGTGKTAAFAIPILQHLYNEKEVGNNKRKIQALIVTPTRELAIQIGESFTTYGKFTGIKNTVIFGGVKQLSQTDALKRGVDVLVATPGRLLDLIQQGFVSLGNVKYFVLDEADHMLDMGFIHDIRKIVEKLPIKRQSLFFSATMPPEIIKLSGNILGNPEKVTIKPEQKTAEKVEQSVYFINRKSKTKLLIHILNSEKYESVLIFSRTKHGANKIVKSLEKTDFRALAIHGNKSQAARQLALKNFKNGNIDILVATDIAARGLDISELSLVINFDLPNVSETYIHRIGRTGRAKFSGIAISFCDLEERPYLKDIQKLIKQEIPVVEDHPFANEEPEEIQKTVTQQQNRAFTPRPNQNKSFGNNSNSRKYKSSRPSSRNK
ncbi:MAG: DEAD/DEAH box helicase [Bacteroidales bacterium]|nr:DEAD/DEAH box helicase [Bacteroidales bacterium]